MNNIEDDTSEFNSTFSNETRSNPPLITAFSMLMILISENTKITAPVPFDNVKSRSPRGCFIILISKLDQVYVM